MVQPTDASFVFVHAGLNLNRDKELALANLSTFSNAMKTTFIGPIRDNMSSNKVLLYGQRTRDEDKKQKDPVGVREWRGIQALADGIDFVGNDFRIPLRSSRNQGTGFRGESVPLPAAGNQGYQYITDPLSYAYGTFNITGQLIKASEKQEGAFRQAVTAEMRGLVDDLKRHTNIAGYGDGTGVVATITTGATSVTQAIDTTIYLQGGEFVDIYDSTLVTYRGTAASEVLSLNRSGLTVTFVASIATTTNDVLIRASASSTSAVPNNDKNTVINGLEKIVDSTGALHGLNPATAGQSFWASTELAAANAVVGDTKLRELCDGIGFESGSDDEIVLITTRGIRNRYAQTLTPLKRFNDADSTTLRGGFKALMFDDKPMVIDDHCRIGRIYALNTDAMFWSQMSDWEWLEEDGSVLKHVSGYDKYEGHLFKYFNLGTYARNRHGKITGAADDVK